MPVDIVPLFQAYQEAVTTDNQEQGLSTAAALAAADALAKANQTEANRKDAVSAFKSAVASMDELGNIPDVGSTSTTITPPVTTTPSDPVVNPPVVTDPNAPVVATPSAA